MEQQRKTLQQESDSLTSQIEALEQALESRPDYSMGEGDPAITEWELNLTLLRRLKVEYEQFQRAIARMETGTYGICEHCGKRINPDRLAVLPDATLCVECAQKESKSRQR
ncbi:MAG: TraR/DksA C4-type zinc finger protein [Anaerolineae bacterium]|nr:TraR/DksA C4-type zinc finger protein [Anaerolineae bacterium]